ncbi:MAG: DEAD/DEAH box helicase [Bacteroidales bacterium]
MTFSELNLNKPLLNALNDLGYTHATSIQEKVFSVMMSGRDVVGIAQTGTGKTIAYLLPCLRLWKYTGDGSPQILIIVPTRELVVQVVKEVNKLTTYLNIKVEGVYGGVNINPQIDRVYAGCDVLVATPGRLLDLAYKGVLRLKGVKRLIIDEVDEMLTLGFRHQLTSILDLLPPRRQNLMFSATMLDDIEKLIKDFFNNPQKIEAAPTGTPLDQIIQIGYLVPNFNTKVNFLKLLLSNDMEMSKVLVFVSTKKLADDLFEQMEGKLSGQLGVIHSNKAQNYRFNAVKQFHEGVYRVLISTDIMARGLDISEITHVVNFDTPEVAEDYMHRIGRTGRADKKGIAITFLLEKDAVYQAQIEELMNYKIPIEALPEDLKISEILTEDELPKIIMKNVLVKTPKVEASGPAFHEKKEKNKKVYNKIRHKDKMKLKYGKPKTRGQKK